MKPPIRPTPRPLDGPLRWTIPSGTKPGEHHLVQLDAYGANGRCSCPDFTCRHEPMLRKDPSLGGVDRTRCKHIRLVRAHFLDQLIEQLSKGIIALFLAFSPLQAAPSDAFLDALAWAETRNRPNLVGDAGLARSAFQFHRCAWTDTSALRAKKGLYVADYDAGTACQATSREYARSLIGEYEARLRRLKLDPTPDRLWLAWTMGWSGAKAIGFDQAKAPAYKRRGLARLKEALGKKSHLVP